MPYRPTIETFKSGQVLVRTCRSKTPASCGKTDHQKTARGAFPGGDVLLQSCGPVRGQSQKADRFWSAPAGRKRQPVVARRITRKQPGALSREVMCCCNRAALYAGNHKKRTGFGPHLQVENASQLRQDGSPENSQGRLSREAMCCCNRAALCAGNHKKRTGFGPQQASSRALRLHAFGGSVRSSEFGPPTIV
jgi:hypothetical protein